MNMWIMKKICNDGQRTSSEVLGDDDESEILVVQVKTENHNIRIINAYGPQEDANKNNIYKFWQEMEEEIVSAKEENCLIVVELDANAKLGPEVIKNDPNNMLKMESFSLI